MSKEKKTNKNNLQHGSIVNKPQNDGIVLDDNVANQMFTPADPCDLPDPKIILKSVQDILTFMTEDETIELKQNNPEVYTNVMKDKFSSFNEKYPSLFDMVIDGNDISMLLEMLLRIDKVKEGKLTMDTAQNQLKDQLSNKYVYSQMPKKKADSLKKEVTDIENKKDK